VSKYYRPPLNACTASSMATRFSTGVPAWTLCTVLNTNPPPGAKTSQRRNTCSRTSWGEPNGKVFCIHTAAPEHDAIAEFGLQLLGLHAGGGTLNGVENVEPASIKEGRNLDTAPHECLNVFHDVCEWIQSLTLL